MSELIITQAIRKGKLASTRNEFNKVVRVDHFYLHDLHLIQAMDIAGLFSAFFIAER